MTGIRRCGKSVMLELIQQELTESGVSPTQFIAINFEDMSYSHLQTAQALHDEITKRAKEIDGKVYLFFDEIQEVKDWEKCINLSAFRWIATSISPAPMQSCCLVSLQPIWADGMWSL